VPKRLAQSVSDGWNTAGDSGTASYSTDQGVVDMIFRRNNAEAITITNVKTAHGCQIREYSDFYYNLTEAEVQAFDIGTPAQGYFYSAPQIRYSGDGKYTVVVVREQAIAVSRDAVTVDDNYDYTDTLTIKENQTTPTEPTQSLGVMQKLSLEFNRFCLWGTKLITRTSKAWDATYTFYTDENRTEIHIIKINQRSVSLPARPSGMVQRFASPPSRNPDGTWNWHIVQSTDETYLGTSGTAYYRSGNRIFREVYNTDTDQYEWLYADVYRTVTVKQFNSVAAAYAYNNTGGNSFGAPVNKVGFNRYIGMAYAELQGNWHDVT